MVLQRICLQVAYMVVPMQITQYRNSRFAPVFGGILQHGVADFCRHYEQLEICGREL